MNVMVKSPSGNQAESYFLEWLSQFDDLLWLFVDQKESKAPAFEEKNGDYGINFCRTVFGAENFSDIPELTDEEIQQIADNYDESTDPFSKKSPDWIVHSAGSLSDNILFRPDIVCMSIHSDHRGTCMIDVKRRWYKANNTMIISVAEARALQHLSHLTNLPVFIAVLEFKPDDSNLKTFDFSNGGYLINVDTLPVFEGEVDELRFKEKNKQLSKVSKPAWRYKLSDIPKKLQFKVGDKNDFDTKNLFEGIASAVM